MFRALELGAIDFVAKPVDLAVLRDLVRHALDLWFESQGVRPLIAGDFDDSALLKAFGQRGLGVFPGAPTPVVHPLTVMREDRSHDLAPFVVF